MISPSAVVPGVELAPRRGAGDLAIALAIVSPLAVLPSAFNPYNLPKLLLMALAIGISVFAQSRGRLPHIVWITVAAGAVAFVAAALASPSPVAGLLGRWPRYEGLPTLSIYLGSAWLGARVLGRPPVVSIRHFRTCAAITAVVLAAFSALDALRISPLGWTSATRTGSLLGNATDQGLVAVMLGAVLLAPALRERSTLLLTGVAASIVTIGLSASRTAILAMLLVTMIHLAALGRRSSRALVLYALALLVAVVSLPQARTRLFTGTTFESRVLAWQETVRLAKDHLWFGVGPSGYSDAIGRYQDPEWVLVVGAAAKPDSPHSWPLQALAAGGYLLLVPALVLAWLIAKAGWRALSEHLSSSARTRVGWTKSVSSRPTRVRAESPTAAFEHVIGLFSAVIAYGGGLLLNFTTPGTTCLAAFLTGALIATPPKPVEHATFRAFVVTAASVAVAGLLMACLGDVALRSGAELAASGRVKLAVERFELAARLRPLDSDVHMLSAEFLAEQASRGDQFAARRAAHEARRSLASTPAAYESKVALGVALTAQGKLRPALEVLDTAVADYPFRSQAYVQRAIARTRLGDVTGGVVDLRRAIALRPDDPVPLRILAEIKDRLARVSR